MLQNRNQLIELFIGNITNAIVHRILEKAIKKEEIADKYRKELITSFEVAKKYREKINPVTSSLPDKDVLYIEEKIIKRVKAELNLRIERGYENIDLDAVEQEIDKSLREAKIM